MKRKTRCREHHPQFVEKTMLPPWQGCPAQPEHGGAGFLSTVFTWRCPGRRRRNGTAHSGTSKVVHITLRPRNPSLRDPSVTPLVEPGSEILRKSNVCNRYVLNNLRALLVAEAACFTWLACSLAKATSLCFCCSLLFSPFLAWCLSVAGVGRQRLVTSNWILASCSLDGHEGLPINMS